MLLAFATMEAFENGFPVKLRRTGLAISEFLELGLGRVAIGEDDDDDDLFEGMAMMRFACKLGTKLNRRLIEIPVEQKNGEVLENLICEERNELRRNG